MTTATSPAPAATTGTEPAPLLRIRDLHIDFAQPRPAVRDVHLDLAEGEVLALVGESGSGKSMTARATLGLLPPGARATGSITLRGTELLGASDDELRRVRGAEVGMVFQEPQTALNPVRTIGWQLREALRAHRSGRSGRSGLSRAEARERSLELLRQVEIPEPESRLGYYPHQLSGGQKQRVVLALALAGEPSLLLADEPTTALDVTVQAEILALLRRINQRTGTGILLITHNMGVVAQLAHRVVVLQLGDVVESGTVEEIFRRPQQPYTKQLLGAVPRLPDPQAAPLHLATTGPTDGAADPVAALSFRDVDVVYPGPRGRRNRFAAVSGVTLQVAPGEVLGLVGESGSGKTTLGRVAAGLVPPAGGQVLVGGRDLASLSSRALREVRRDLAFVPQDPAASLDPRMSVGTSVREPLDVHRVGTRAERQARVAELLDAVRLPAELAERRPQELSGGQRQRVALARALALRPDLVVADEPTSALDVSIQAEVLDLFARLQSELGFACVFISHDLAVVHRVSDRVAVLRAGRLVEVGPTDRVFAAPAVDYTRRLIAAVPAPEVPAAPQEVERAS